MYLILLCLLSFFFSLSMSSLARRNTSVISASMDMETGEDPGGWPGAGLKEVEGNGEREESRVTCRRNDSFMDSLSRSLVLRKKEDKEEIRHNSVVYLFFLPGFVLTYHKPIVAALGDVSVWILKFIKWDYNIKMKTYNVKSCHK